MSAGALAALTERRPYPVRAFQVVNGRAGLADGEAASVSDLRVAAARAHAHRVA